MGERAIGPSWCRQPGPGAAEASRWRWGREGGGGDGPGRVRRSTPPAACVVSGGAAGALRGRCPASTAAAAPPGPSPCWGGGREIANEISVNCSLLQV